MVKTYCDNCETELTLIVCPLKKDGMEFCNTKCYREYMEFPADKAKEIEITLGLHSSKESSYDAGEEAGLEGEALNRFMYTGYEEMLTYLVNVETGESKLIKVNDLVLPKT